MKAKGKNEHPTARMSVTDQARADARADAAADIKAALEALPKGLAVIGRNVHHRRCEAIVLTEDKVMRNVRTFITALIATAIFGFPAHAAPINDARQGQKCFRGIGARLYIADALWTKAERDDPDQVTINSHIRPLRISEVIPDSPATKASTMLDRRRIVIKRPLARNDIITAVDGVTLDGLTLEAAIILLDFSGEDVYLRVIRDGGHIGFQAHVKLGAVCL